MSTTAPEQAPPGGATFTLTSAAEATGVSKRTLLRKMDTLVEYGAEQSPDGTWSIPLRALFAIGANPGAPRTGDRTDTAPGQAPGESAPGTGAGTPRTGDVHPDLVELRVRAEVAEARLVEQTRVLAERDRLIASLEQSQRQLLAAKPDDRELHNRIETLQATVRDLAAKPAPEPDRELAGRLDGLQATVRELAAKSENTASPWLIPVLIVAAMVICTVLLIVFLH